MTHAKMYAILPSAGLLGMLLILSLPAQAQTTAPPTAEASSVVEAMQLPISSPVWRANFGKQLAASLRARNANIRAGSLQNAVYFAANYNDALDLKPALPVLLSIYERDRNAAHRIMALAALYAIGDEAAMRALARLSQRERSRHVRRLTRLALSDYAGARYYQEREARYQRRADRHLRLATRSQERADYYKGKRRKN